MASTKKYRDYVLEQLSEVPDMACRPMMGEFLLYSEGILFGGIYDNRLLIKIVPENRSYNLPKETPYEGAKSMYFVGDVDNKDHLSELIKVTKKGLLNKK